VSIMRGTSVAKDFFFLLAAIYPTNPPRQMVMDRRDPMRVESPGRGA